MKKNNWPNLPDSYGNGERHFDMAMAARDTAEPYVFGTAIGVAAGLHYWVPVWLAILQAIGCYFLAMMPIKRNLKIARAMMQEDIRAYQEYLDSDKDD